MPRPCWPFWKNAKNRKKGASHDDPAETHCRLCAVRQLFCSFSAVLPQIQVLTARGWEILPILSASAAGLDTRFGTAAALRQTLLELTGHEPLTTLQGVEPLGPQKAGRRPLSLPPATGTTMALLAAGISATPVTLAAKRPSAWRSAGHTGPLHQRRSGGQRPGAGPAFCSGAATILCPSVRMTATKSPQPEK